jgi:hypothetical protein
MLTRLELQCAAVRQRNYRIAQLVGEIIEYDNAATPAIVAMISVATCMARYLPPPTRITIAARMEDEARALRGLVH